MEIWKVRIQIQKEFYNIVYFIILFCIIIVVLLVIEVYIFWRKIRNVRGISYGILTTPVGVRLLFPTSARVDRATR